MASLPRSSQPLPACSLGATRQCYEALTYAADPHIRLRETPGVGSEIAE